MATLTLDQIRDSGYDADLVVVQLPDGLHRVIMSKSDTWHNSCQHCGHDAPESIIVLQIEQEVLTNGKLR